jgi:hypothetical protein
MSFSRATPLERRFLRLAAENPNLFIGQLAPMSRIRDVYAPMCYRHVLKPRFVRTS